MREGACAEQVLGGTLHCDRAEPAVAMFLKGLMSSGSLSKEAVTLFFDGATSEDPPVMEKHGWVTRPSFLPPDRWALLIALVDQTDCLHWVPQHLAEHQDEWGAWCAGPHPEAAALPPTPHEVSPLERLLLLRAMHPDRAPHALALLLDAACAGALAEFPRLDPSEAAAPARSLGPQPISPAMTRQSSFATKFGEHRPAADAPVPRGPARLSRFARRALLGGVGCTSAPSQWLRMAVASAAIVRAPLPGMPQSIRLTEPVPVLILKVNPAAPLSRAANTAQRRSAAATPQRRAPLVADAGARPDRWERRGLCGGAGAAAVCSGCGRTGRWTTFGTVRRRRLLVGRGRKRTSGNGGSECSCTCRVLAAHQ